MIFEWRSHKDNFLVRLRDDGTFETHSSLAFLFEFDRRRGRYTIPAGSNLGRRVHARRERAKLVRNFAWANGWARREVAEVYVAALRADGARVRPWTWLGLVLLRRLG